MKGLKLSSGALLFLGALAVRLLFLWQWSQTPFYLTPQLDDQIHLLWAREILSGGIIRETAFFQSPLYPYLLALVLKLTALRPAVMLWLQALAGAAACWVLAEASGRIFNRRAGLLAGGIAAVYGPFLFFGVLLLKETLLILSLALFLRWFLRAQDSGASRDALVCGALLGISALFKGNALALAAVPMILWARGKSGRLAWTFLAGLGLAILPATLHNAVASRDFVLISYNTGLSVYMGNNLDSSGTMSLPHGIAAHPRLEEIQSVKLARIMTRRELTPSQVSRFWMGKAVKFVLKNPGTWLKQTVFKLYLFWNRYELPDNYDIQFMRRNFKTLLAWPLPSFALAAVLGLLGIALYGWKDTASRVLLWLFAVYMITVAGGSVTGRYRLASLVFLLPFAGAALDRILTPGFAKSLKGHGLALACALGLAVVCLIPWPRYSENDKARGWSLVAQAFFERGQYRETIVAFTTALNAAPKAVGAAAFLAAGSSAERLGEPDSAHLIYKTGTEVHPYSGALMGRRNRLEER